MTDDEIKIAVRGIITSSSSEDEVHQRIKDELGYSGRISLTTTIPDNEKLRQERSLVVSIGGMVMKNGAMAMAMLWGHEKAISL